MPPSWPGPQDSPTGTPDTSKRAKGRDIIANAQQLPTPLETQQGSRSGVIDLHTQLSGEGSPAIPTPGERPTLDQRSGSTASGGRTPGSPPSSKRPFYAWSDENSLKFKDEDYDLSLETGSQGSPTPAKSWSEVASRSSSPAASMNDFLFQRSEPSLASPNPSVLVPDTPVNALGHNKYDHPTYEHMHISQSVSIHSIVDPDEPERTELERLRIRRAIFTNRLNESTAQIGRLQLRNKITLLDLLRERAVSASATEARKAVEAKREEAVAEVREVVMRKERLLGRVQVAFPLLVLAVMAYMAWCHVHQVEHRYIRRAEERRFGL